MDTDFFPAGVGPLEVFLHPLSHAHSNCEGCARIGALTYGTYFLSALPSRVEGGMMGGKADNDLPPSAHDHRP